MTANKFASQLVAGPPVCMLIYLIDHLKVCYQTVTLHIPHRQLLECGGSLSRTNYQLDITGASKVSIFISLVFHPP